MAYTQQDVIDAIVQAAAGDPHLEQAMLLGSWYESSWNPNERVMDSNGKYSSGPFMINEAPGNTYWDDAGQNSANTMDPYKAAQIMKASYQAQVQRVSESQWQSDPAAAAEQAAYGAEAPAVSYLNNYGRARLDQGYSAVVSALKGAPQSATNTDPGSSGNGTAPDGSVASDISSSASNATPKVPAVNTPQIKQYIKDNFPSYGWILDLPPNKGGKEIADVLEEVVHKGMDSNQIASRVEQTQWWKDTSTAFKTWQQTKAYNPGDLSFNTPGSTAQAMLGQINTASASVGLQLPQGIAENLATEALMYGWDSNDIQRNIRSVAATGAGQVYNPNFLSMEQQNPRLYQISGKGGMGPLATSTYNNIAQAAASQGVQLTLAEHVGLTQQADEFGWQPADIQAHLRALTTKGNSQFDPTFMQGMLNNPEWYKPGGLKYQAMLTQVQQLAGNTSGVQLTAAEQAALTTYALEHNSDNDQITAHIKQMATLKNSQYATSYLGGLLVNPKQFAPGGVAYENMLSQVQSAAAMTNGVTLTAAQQKQVTSLALEKGWDGQTLINHIGALAANVNGQSYSTQYLTGVLENPKQYEWGKGVTAKATQASLETAAAKAGVSLSKAQQKALGLLAMQGNWNPDQFTTNIAKVAPFTKDHNWSPQYLTGVLTNPTAYQPGGFQYRANYAQLQNAAAGNGILFTPDELANLTEKSLHENWTQEQINTYLGQTAREGKGKAYNPGYLTEQLVNSDELKFEPGTLASQQLTTVRQAFDAAGIKRPPDSVMEKLATESLMYGGMNGVPANILRQWASAYGTGATTLDQNYLTTLNTNPGEFDFTDYTKQQAKGVKGAVPGATEADKALTAVEIAAGNKMANLTQGQARTLALQSLEAGWSSDQLNQQIANMIYVHQQAAAPPRPANLPPGQPQQQGQAPFANTNAPGLEQEVSQQASQYFQQLSPAVMQQWMKQLTGGTQTTANLNGYLADQAAKRWPAMEKDLKNGLTPAQITSHLQQLASNTLEIDPSQVNFTSNPQFAKMLDGGYDVGKDGQKVGNGQMMTYSQAGNYLRGLPQWQDTVNAKQAGADVATQILQDFGRIG